MPPCRSGLVSCSLPAATRFREERCVVCTEGDIGRQRDFACKSSKKCAFHKTNGMKYSCRIQLPLPQFISCLQVDAHGSLPLERHIFIHIGLTGVQFVFCRNLLFCAKPSDTIEIWACCVLLALGVCDTPLQLGAGNGRQTPKGGAHRRGVSHTPNAKNAKITNRQIMSLACG